jgi:hypothetical protein
MLSVTLQNEQQLAAARVPEVQVPTVVPERPVLAPHVQLIGEMRDTGFTNRQCLIQRDGRFIQVTELLYRVVEQINGQRTIEEIAAGITEATEWSVSTDNVRQLLQTKLIPLGLVVSQKGVVISQNGERPRSVLQINMRKKIYSVRALLTRSPAYSRFSTGLLFSFQFCWSPRSPTGGCTSYMVARAMALMQPFTCRGVYSWY